MSESHTIEGYATCRGCGDAWVLREIAARTGGYGTCCYQPDAPRTVELIGYGTRVAIPVEGVKTKKRKSPKGPKTPEAKAREKKIAKCRERARKRLSHMFPDMYDILLAEERAAVGLEPWPTEMAVRHHGDPDGSETRAFAALIFELEEAGVDTR